MTIFEKRTEKQQINVNSMQNFLNKKTFFQNSDWKAIGKIVL